MRYVQLLKNIGLYGASAAAGVFIIEAGILLTRQKFDETKQTIFKNEEPLDKDQLSKKQSNGKS